MRIGQLLRKWRASSDLTIRDVADQIGITLSTLSRVERGEAMDAVTLAKILMWLLGEKEK